MQKRWCLRELSAGEKQRAGRCWSGSGTYSISAGWGDAGRAAGGCSGALYWGAAPAKSWVYWTTGPLLLTAPGGEGEKPKSQQEKSLMLPKVGCMGPKTPTCAWMEPKPRDLRLTEAHRQAQSTATAPKILVTSPKSSLVLWYYSRTKIPLEN